jgi:hypothetical protein
VRKRKQPCGLEPSLAIDHNVVSTDKQWHIKPEAADRGCNFSNMRSVELTQAPVPDFEVVEGERLNL